jgi:2-oxoglutarate ferredoxin oxidoreductase subunit gamma
MLKTKVYDKIIIAGFGGQGALLVGRMIAHAGLEENKEVSWLPSYGSEMRGGTANCSVIVSDNIVPSPVIQKPNFVVVMNKPSFDKFEKMVEPGGKLIVNSSLIEDKSQRTDIDVYYIPANEIANETGDDRSMNMIFLGAYVALTESISLESVFTAIENNLTGSKEKYIDSNKLLIQKGYDLIKKL